VSDLFHSPEQRANSAVQARLFFRWHELPPGERLARLRSLQAIARLFAGGASPLVGLLRRAEANEVSLDDVWVALNALPTRTFRNVLATFAATLPEGNANGGA
jgi:hypothetical protein